MNPPDPLPPKLHWAVVLLLSVATLGIFYVVWIFIQARWVKRIDNDSQATSLLVIYVVLSLAGDIVIESSTRGSGAAVAGGLLIVAGLVAGTVGFFSERRSMLAYYRQRRPQGLYLSPAWTALMGPFYLQYHMRRLAQQQA